MSISLVAVFEDALKLCSFHQGCANFNEATDSAGASEARALAYNGESKSTIRLLRRASHCKAMGKISQMVVATEHDFTIYIGNSPSVRHAAHANLEGVHADRHSIWMTLCY